MKQSSPIKRSKELAPLSREHHEGLQFVWKIRQGLANGTSAETMSKFTNWFWRNHIKPHFYDEEKVLTAALPAQNKLVKQMCDEHAQIRDMILCLDRDPDIDTLRMMADFLNNHIRFEERELFNYAEKTLTPEQLQNVFSQLVEPVACDTEWKEEFWLNKKT